MSTTKPKAVLPKGLIATYMRLVVPEGNARPFHYRARFDWPMAKFKDTDKPRYFRPCHVEQHLLGKQLYAVRWHLDRHAFFGSTNFAVIDLDFHEELEELVQRLGDVEAALGPIPYVLIRSSSSSGFHLYVFFDEYVATARVRDTLVSLLARFGLKVRKGYIEVWPDNHALRLPLGRGSCIINPDTFEKQAAYLDKGNRLRRDIGASVKLLWDLAEKARGPFADLEARASGAPVVIEPVPVSGVALQRMQDRVAGARGLALKGKDYWDDIEASELGISGPGLRFDQARRRVSHLRIVKELPPHEVMREFERWLRTGQHRSRDLQQDREGTIRKMLADARSYLAYLERAIQAGRLTPGMSRKHAPKAADAALSCILPIVQHEARSEGYAGPRWREFAARHLTPQDEAIIQTTGDPWLISKLRVLIGALRFADGYCGPLSTMTLSRTELQRIAGGKPPPASALVAATRDGTRMANAAYTVVLAAAKRLGIVRFITWGKAKLYASVYAVTLPSPGTRRALPTRPLALNARKRTGC